MLAIFASEAAGAVNTNGVYGLPLVKLAIVVVAIFIFIKFCGWAKKCQLSGGAKKFVFILTGLGLVVFNVLYSMGNSVIDPHTGAGDWTGATIALVSSLVWVFIFAFALMSETKAE